MVVVGRLDQKMPGPIFCPSPALIPIQNNLAVHHIPCTSLRVSDYLDFSRYPHYLFEIKAYSDFLWNSLQKMSAWQISVKNVL